MKGRKGDILLFLLQSWEEYLAKEAKRLDKKAKKAKKKNPPKS